MTKSERGILSEWWVVCDRLTRFGDALVVHRKRTPYAEIDLLFLCPHDLTHPSGSRQLLLIEVKSVLGEQIWGESLISHRQTERLKRARLFLQSHYRLPVRLMIAAVLTGPIGQPTAPQVRYFQVHGDAGS